MLNAWPLLRLELCGIVIALHGPPLQPWSSAVHSDSWVGLDSESAGMTGTLVSPKITFLWQVAALPPSPVQVLVHS
jgi:hypothetical protein